MRFHAIQHNVVPNDPYATSTNVELLINQSAVKTGDFVVLPEMSLTGFSLNINTLSNGNSLAWGKSFAKEKQIWLQVGWANRIDGRAKNCVSICNPHGEVIATYEKIFTCNPFGENQIIDKGTELLIVEIEGQKICPLICYDLRFPELWRLATQAGADIFTNSANWPKARIYSWSALLIARAIENQAQVIGCNRIGKDDVANWGGCSAAISEEGFLMAKASEYDAECLSAEFNQSASIEWRQQFKVLQDLDSKLLGNIDVRHIST